MVMKRHQNPVEGMLASLVEDPEIENYKTDEIEAMPIEQVRKRLGALGVDCALPGYIRSLANSYVVPAQKVLQSLDTEFDQLSPEVIEHLEPEEVRAKLNDLGLNYLTGTDRARELTGSDFNSQENQIRQTVKDSPSHEQKRRILQRHFLFGKLSGDEMDSLIRDAHVERYPAGHEIYAKGSRGQSLMAVLRGSVRLRSLSEDGKEVVFGIFNAGQIFGEMAVLDGEARSADAIAMTDCELLLVNRRELLPILENRADLCMILLKVLSRRVRQTSNQVEDLMSSQPESRVAKALLRLAEKTGGVHGPEPKLYLSPQMLGDIAGGNRESISKHLLQQWHHQGLIDFSEGAVMIRDLEALKRLSADFDPTFTRTR
jgi:CRP/FNR family transcriptional regulator, cyclic AMP receptor protein